MISSGYKYGTYLKAYRRMDFTYLKQLVMEAASSLKNLYVRISFDALIAPSRVVQFVATVDQYVRSEYGVQ